MAERARSGGSGYSSDPTASSPRGARNTVANALEAPSFTSLRQSAGGGPGLSLLQSTPNAKVHRVQRANAVPPASSSHTGTEDLELSSLDVSLASASTTNGRHQQPEETPESLVQSTAKRPLPVRQYWNNLLLESAGASKPFRANANAPSTGSSTLVDQEVFPEAQLALDGPSNLQYQYAQLEQAYERPASAPLPAETSRRSSPLQEHLSRFASESQQESSRESSSATPQPSLAAARVRDIFARHVHNAPSASTSRNTSLAVSGDGRPRQRLRDLLTPSERRSTAVAHHHTYQPEQPSSPSPKRPKRPISPITNAQIALYNSPSRSLSERRPTSRQIAASPRQSGYDPKQASAVSPKKSGTRLATVGRSISDQSLHARTNSGSLLSREWQAVVARSAASESESAPDEEADADAEEQEEGRAYTIIHVLWTERLYLADLSPDLGDDIALEDEQLTDVQEPDHTADGSEEEDVAERESSSPRYTTEEEIEEDDEDGRCEPGEETREIGSAQVQIAERRVSPRASAEYSSPRLLTTSRSRKTPPKTPHPPGFYHSITPGETVTPATAARRGRLVDLATPLPVKAGQADLSRLDSSKSRLFGYLNTPAPPGAYRSPFPHPKRALVWSTGTGAKQEHNDSVQDQSRRGRAQSTTPQSSPPKPKQRTAELVRSPPRARTNASRIQDSPTPGNKGSKKPSSPTRQRTESTESVLQSMMAELVRPLKSLLSSIGPSKQIEHVSREHDDAEPVKDLQHVDVLTERCKRKVGIRLLQQNIADLGACIDGARHAAASIGRSRSARSIAVYAARRHPTGSG